MILALVGLGALVCALGAILAKRLLISAIWLAGTSALVALEMYLLGAPLIAVVELSVGAGLVTVLFVFAINLAGEESHQLSGRSLTYLSLIILLLNLGLLAYLTLPTSLLSPTNPDDMPLKVLFWENRRLDVWLQAAIIFAGALTVLGLLRATSAEAGHKKEEL
jgi:NADH:ubiquinone oxidoreductase subunit 6 (subunit J)